MREDFDNRRNAYISYKRESHRCKIPLIGPRVVTYLLFSLSGCALYITICIVTILLIHTALHILLGVRGVSFDASVIDL